MLKFAITIIGVIALFRLWGSPYRILWWSILVLLVLDWLSAETVKTASRQKSDETVVRFWVWTNMGISLLCLVLSITGVTLSYTKSNSSSVQRGKHIEQSQPASDKERCKAAIMSFIQAHAMQSDDSGNVIQLSREEEQQMKRLIQSAIGFAESVSDSFLNSIHSELQEQFREHLVKGWRTYLDGLEFANVQGQVEGIELLQSWETYRAANADLLYESIIK